MQSSAGPGNFLSEITMRLVIEWPSGKTEEYKSLPAGRAYECVEAKGNHGFGGLLEVIARHIRKPSRQK